MADFDWLSPSILLAGGEGFERVSLEELYDFRLSSSDKRVGVTCEDYLRGIQDVLKRVYENGVVSTKDEELLEIVRAPYDCLRS